MASAKMFSRPKTTTCAKQAFGHVFIPHGKSQCIVRFKIRSDFHFAMERRNETKKAEKVWATFRFICVCNFWSFVSECSTSDNKHKSAFGIQKGGNPAQGSTWQILKLHNFSWQKPKFIAVDMRMTTCGHHQGQIKYLHKLFPSKIFQDQD